MRGLNLTLAVREGIVKHSRDYSPSQHPELAEYFLNRFPPLEAQMIDLADEIAYLTADLDDGLDSGILSLDQVREGVPLFRRFHEAVVRLYPAATNKLAINETLRRVLNALVTDMLDAIHAQVRNLGAETLEDIRRAPARIALLSPAMEADRAQAKKFLYSRLYNSPGMERIHERAELVVRELFVALMADPTQLPPDHQVQIATEGLARTVADYIAGMTDSFIQQSWIRQCGAERS
jgi:dGTPase